MLRVGLGRGKLNTASQGCRGLRCQQQACLCELCLNRQWPLPHVVASSQQVRVWALTPPELSLWPCPHCLATLSSRGLVCKSCMAMSHILSPHNMTGTFLFGERPSCILPSQGRTQKLTSPTSLQSSHRMGLGLSHQMHQP